MGGGEERKRGKMKRMNRNEKKRKKEGEGDNKKTVWAQISSIWWMHLRAAASFLCAIPHGTQWSCVKPHYTYLQLSK